LEDEVWRKIADILQNPDKLGAVIRDTLEILRVRQAELDLTLKPINEKLLDITDKKARLADQWVITNMDPDKYKKLQSNLNKEEIRLKSLRANMSPSRLAELENINETLGYWQNQFNTEAIGIEGIGGGLKLLEKTNPSVKTYGFDDMSLVESITSTTIKRQILEKLQANLVVFHDRIEIGCQIPIEADKSFNLILNLDLPPTRKDRRHVTAKS
jgi:hypothetical protein